MTSKSETTPLVGSTGENPSYYFLQRTESMMKSTDNMEAEGEVVEMQPNGATGGEFDSRPVKTGGRARTPKKKATFWGATLKPPSGRIGQSGGAARGGSPSKRISGAILRQRQGAIKVEETDLEPIAFTSHPLDDAPWWRKTAIILKRAVHPTGVEREYRGAHRRPRSGRNPSSQSRSQSWRCAGRSRRSGSYRRGTVPCR